MKNKTLEVNKQGLFKGTPIYIGVTLVLILVLVFSILAAVTMGSVDISAKDIYSIIFYKLFDIGN